MRKTILLWIFILMLVSSVTAAEFDNAMDYNPIENEITIYNYFGLVPEWLADTKLAEYTLEKNTDFCLSSCEAEGKVTLYTPTKLFKNIDYKNRNGDLENIAQTIIEIGNIEIYYVEVSDIQTVCSERLNTNSSLEEVCEQKTVGKKQVEKERIHWEEYNQSELIGRYAWRIKGTKLSIQAVDWGFETLGIKADEIREHWAWWDGDYLGCKNLQLNTTLTRTNVILTYNITGLTFKNITEIRIIDKICGRDGKEVKSSVLFNDTTTARVTWLANLTGIQTNFSVYYNNPTNPAKAKEATYDHCDFTDYEGQCGWSNGSTSTMTIEKGILNFSKGGMQGRINRSIPNFIMKWRIYAIISAGGYGITNETYDNADWGRSKSTEFRMFSGDARQAFTTQSNLAVSVVQADLSSFLGAWYIHWINYTTNGTGTYSTHQTLPEFGESTSYIGKPGLFLDTAPIYHISMYDFDAPFTPAAQIDYIRIYEPESEFIGIWEEPNLSISAELSSSGNVSLIYPADDAVVTIRQVNFTYNVTDDLDNDIDNCTLWINNVKNLTDETIQQRVNQTFNITLNNTHINTWLVGCYNNISLQSNSTVFNFVFNNPPTVPAITPANNTIYTNETSINITCSGSTDSESDTINYAFYNGSNTGALKMSQNSTLETFKMYLARPEKHYFDCRASDNITASAFAGERTATLADVYPNCSLSNATTAIAYNFTFKEEVNFTSLTDVTISSAWTIWGNDSTSNKTVTLNKLVVNNSIAYCISPQNYTAVYVKGIVEYSKVGYDTRYYYLDDNDIISNVSNEVILYLTLSVLTDDIDITITDAADIPLKNILTEAWLYDVGTDSYSLVQTETTNPSGECQMQLILNRFYLFKFYLNGVLQDSTVKFKLTSTSLTFKITTPEEPLDPTVDLRELLTNFSWVNSTKNISFNFSRAENVDGLSDLCWAVDNMSAQNISTLYSHCFTSPTSGEDDYIITTTRGYFRAYAYALVKGIRYSINSYEIDLREKPVFGSEGLVLGLLLVLALGGLGLASRNPAVTIMMVLFAIIINYMTFLWVINWYALVSIIVVGVILLIMSKT